MSYLFHTPGQERSDGSTSMAFRVTAAILAAAAVMLFFVTATSLGIDSPVPWIAAVATAGVAFMLAQALIVVIMIVVPPVLLVAVLVRFLVS